MTGWVKPRSVKLIATLAAVMLLIACSGGDGSGGGGTGVEALTLPSRIELTQVEAEGGSGASPGLSRSMAGGISALYSDAGTDYSEEEKHTWVEDTDALDMINDILTACKDTGYEHFVNQGPYKALVRQVGDKEESQSGSNTTNTTTEKLMEMYVNVTRASNTAPMIVKIWVEEEDGPGEQPMLIRGHFTVTEGVSTQYPYGVMTAHFKGTTLDGDQDMFHMAMSVNAEDGNVIIETVEDSEEGGQYGFHSKVQVVANADVSQGNAYVWESDTWLDWDSGNPTTKISEERIAFNEDYFKVTDLNEGGTTTYYSKDDLMHRIYNYKLFNAADGSKLDMNSGLPIETAEGKHAYIGYWGLWTPHGVSIENGETVTDMDGNEFTVFLAGGKLTKHSQDSIRLSELYDMELSKWECGGETECTDVIVSWNGSDFIKLGTRNQSNGMVEYCDGEPGCHDPVSFEKWDGAWCEPLRAYLRLGNLYFNASGTPRNPTGTDWVFFHSEQTVTPQIAAALGNLTLFTWEFTMVNPITQNAVNNFQTDRNSYWNNPPTQKTFNFDAADLMLKDTEGNPVTLEGMTIPEDSDLQWGYHIGPLTTTEYTENNFWQAHESDEDYYTWNTGNNEWNQFATLIDSDSNFVSFSAPIVFSYTHSTENDINDVPDYDGMKFRMEYDGTSVHIPWEFDPDTQEWEPQINIKDGVLMGDSNQYVIKATEQSLIMAEIPNPGTTFPTNEAGEPNLVYDATRTAQVGAIPAGAELKVIKGELID